MKKVGLVVNSIGFGGNERSAVNIAGALSGRYDIAVITQEDRGNHYGFDGRVINLDTPCAATRTGKVINAVRRTVRLKRVLRTFSPDCLMVILPVSNPINYLPFDCRKIVSCRDCGDLMRNTEKYIRMAKASDAIVCNASFMSRYLTEKAPALSGKVHTVHNILDIDRVIRQSEESTESWFDDFTAGHRVITAAGRFTAAKGWSNLLKAFSVLADWCDVRLILMGDGEQRGEIEKIIRELRLEEKVLLPGFQDNPFRCIARSDAFVLPSLYEGLPNMMIESMACGVPVIAEDCPSGPAEILRAEAGDSYTVADSGILVRYIPEGKTNWDSADIGEAHLNLANAMEKVLLDRALAQRLGENARAEAMRYRASAIVPEWEKIL